jgi:hypothetical protein
MNSLGTQHVPHLLKHELLNVLGNLRALDHILFLPTTDLAKRAEHRRTYQTLLKRLETLLAQIPAAGRSPSQTAGCS